MAKVRFALLDYDAGYSLAAHKHPEGQILFARSGVMDVTAGNKLFVIPSTRLIWIPPRVAHQIHFRTPTKLRTAYVKDYERRKFFTKTCVFQTSALFRALLIRLVEDIGLKKSFRTLLSESLLEELMILKEEPFSLRLPQDARALRVVQALLKHPSDQRKIEGWADLAMCSAKTLSRLFIQETDLPFRLWRRHLRLIAALEYLDKGVSVTTAAHAVGFSTSSAFAEAHRLTFGYPPTGAPFQSRKVKNP